MTRPVDEGSTCRTAAVAIATMRRSCALVGAAVVLAALGCAVEGAAPALADAAVSAPAPARIVIGSLAYGETSAPVTTGGLVRVRAFTFAGEAGDQVTIDVRSSDGGDARTWLFASNGRLLAYSDDGDDGAPDSHLEVTLPAGGTHLIVFVDAAYRRRTFTVELQGGPPVRPALAIGFTWNDSRLVTFDPAAGAIQEVHLQMGAEAFIGMAYDPNHDVVYAVSQVAWNLYAIAPATMETSHLGKLRIDTPSRGEDLQGLAYDPIHDVLYATVARFEYLDDRTTWSTDLVRVDTVTAAVTTVGTIPRILVSSLDLDVRDGQLYGIGKGVDGLCRVVRIDPADATSVEVLATPYETMLGFARRPGTGTYLSWINAEGHFYGEVDLDRGTITPLGNADAVRVIAAFVHRSFDAGAVPVPRPEVPASFLLTGQVLAVHDPDGLLDGSVASGDRLTGRLVYDVNTPYRRGPAPAGRYGIAVSLGGAELAIDTLGAQVRNDTFDDRDGPRYDSILIGATREGAPGFPVPMGYELISWALVDATARALANNDVLPVAYDLAAWDQNLLTIRAASHEYADDGYSITAVVDTITPE
jgi:hypothetical protein